jgi:hypothetical protein
MASKERLDLAGKLSIGNSSFTVVHYLLGMESDSLQFAVGLWRPARGTARPGYDDDARLIKQTEEEFAPRIIGVPLPGYFI